MRYKRASSTDVAHKAGVSRTTVSYVLNGREDVAIPEETRRRVMEAARALNYTPNPAARALVTGRMHVVAFWVPVYGPSIYHTLIREGERVIGNAPYERMVCPMSSLTNERERRAVVTRWPVDGILACDGPDHVRAFLQARGEGRLPAIVNIGVYASPEADDCVFADLTPAMQEATEYLIARGRKRVAYLVSSWGNNPADSRYRGYCAAVQAAGRAPEIIEIRDASAASAAKELPAYIAAQGCPDAILCFSDDIALGAYRALRQAGMRVPDDVALIGCDGAPEMAYLEVALSTVAQPVAEMCELGWRFLQERMEDPAAAGERRVVTLQPKLVLRESSG